MAAFGFAAGTSFMKWRNWFEILMPTILVGIVWLGLSVVTSVYISWLDRRYQDVMNENVASIMAAAEMQHALWELQVSAVTSATGPSPAASPLASDASVADKFRAALATASSIAFTREEQLIVQQIRERFDEYLRELDLLKASQATPMRADPAAAMAADIASLCDRLRSINQGLIERWAVENRQWSARVIGMRILVTVLGPLIGVWLGYRVASRLQRRLTAIHVTLEGAAAELGQVLVEPAVPDGNLDAIDRQVREVADRLHQVLSELEGARQEAIRNDRLAAVGQLAAGIAHELRNPLTAVKLLVQTAAHRAATDGSRQEQLSVVQDEIARMEGTIQSLLDFARPSLARRVRSDLREILRRAVNLVEGRARQAEIHVELPEVDEPLWATCDSEQLHQVFVNLLLNGMDAMPGGGIVSIELRRREAGPDDAVCEVAVIDQGEGIPANLLDHVFEPFVTTKLRGTGLGLAISRRLVEEHGGRLTARNCPGQGTVFTVQLPCEPAADSRTMAERTF